MWAFTPAPSLGQDINGCYITLNSQAFIHALYDTTLRKLAIRSLRRGIGSMDYIQSLIGEDDLDENMGVSDDGGTGEADSTGEQTEQQDIAEGEGSAVAATTEGEAIPPWCTCLNCRPIVDPSCEK